MGVWLWSGQTALLAGSVVFALAFFPMLAWQFRHYGAWNGRRMIGAAAFSLYLTALVTYTWLPLPPNSERWCYRHGISGIRETPLASLQDIATAVAGQSPAQALVNPVLLQVVFNVVLFLPWGVLMRRYLGKPIWFATLSGALVSLFIETTQYTGLWFLYPCAYRTADVDDLLTNTLGAFLGAVLAPLILWWMPSERLAAARRLTPRPITVWRRWTGMAIDAAALLGISTLLAVTSRAALIAITGRADATTVTWLDHSAIVLTWAAVFVIPCLDRGGSLGQHIVWLIPQWPRRDDTYPGTGEWYDGRLWQRLARSLVGGVPFLVLGLIGLGTGFSSPLLTTVTLLCLGVLAVSIALVPFTRTHRSLSGILTGAVLDDERNTEDDD